MRPVVLIFRSATYRIIHFNPFLFFLQYSLVATFNRMPAKWAVMLQLLVNLSQVIEIKASVTDDFTATYHHRRFHFVERVVQTTTRTVPRIGAFRLRKVHHVIQQHVTFLTTNTAISSNNYYFASFRLASNAACRSTN